MNASKGMTEYFDRIDSGVLETYELAKKARELSFDPEQKVDIPIAKGVAQRVEGLISAVSPKILGSGVAQRIVQLEKKYGQLDWRVALKIAEEVAQDKFYRHESKLKAMETGIRVGLAYITLGVISAPLEGFIELKIKKRRDGKEYLSAFYAGPIRAAGGTAEAFSVIIADYVRIKMGYYPYDPTAKEILRTAIEIRDYHDRVTNLQYVPSEEEITYLVEHMPIEINGDPTEDFEVSNYKDLERVETNRIRGGICLVVAEGMAQKAKKIDKQLQIWGKEFGIDWGFLTEFLELQKKAKAKGEKTETKAKITPNYTFIEDLVAGRPVLSFPMRVGGLRLRYGRTRTTGLAAAAIHPRTMDILNNYIATGTQLKMERPGKAAAIVPCDSIDGPIVKIKDGSVLQLSSNKVKTEEIDKILFLGDVLFNYGDFSENGHRLVPAGYCQEWWIKDLEKAAVGLFGSLDIDKCAEIIGAEPENIRHLFESPMKIKISARMAFRISKQFRIPLHPDYTYFWQNITKEELSALSEWISSANVKKEDEKITKLILGNSQKEKEILEKIGMPHLLVNREFIVIEKEHAHTVYMLFIKNQEKIKDALKKEEGTLEILSAASGIQIMDKGGTFIGARMGRPEKAKMRKLTGSPHFLFPVGAEGGRLKSLQSAFEKKKITAEFPVFFCEKCSKETIFSVCETCATKTRKRYYCETCKIIAEKCQHDRVYEYMKRDIDINDIFTKTLERAGLSIYPDLIKGVRGTSNRTHITENLLKGVLRAKHKIYVNKDGTTRYDMIELPITHFRPKEIGTSIAELQKLGYKHDIHGKKLESAEQVAELKPQDMILPGSPESAEEPADEMLYRTANFIDELLARLYRLPPYYNLKTKKDIIGHLVVGLAPHTSAGTVGRVIGFSKTQGMLTHPMFHAAMRRNCDGDEASVILLLDAFLNFSRSYLPDKRGSRTMDAPLVLTSLLVPGEVDDEVHGMDIAWSYPLELYEAALEYKYPWEVEILQIDDVLNTEEQYEGMGYTHEISDINSGVLRSAYKLLPTMQDKLMGQMDLAEKIVAVNTGDVAQLVIEKHFLKDIRGNLRKFSTQRFRCVSCNKKYRRPPLAGRCTSCQGKIIFTVAEGSIVKYLQPTISLAEKYKVSDYLMQTLYFLQKQVDSVLGKEKERQEGLGKWFG
ncbi:DNA polymerase II large subunit [archaeon GW2011_AR15]|nr:DNA polymerase II large subunit [archaeon GW2011_AR15]MBS3103902.1 DNA polymerase II large subunit [Candidatus Woesearchaeota archaeon]